MAEPVYDVDDARAITDAVALVTAAFRDDECPNETFALALERLVNGSRCHIAHVVETLLGFTQALIETHCDPEALATFEDLAVKVQQAAGVIP